jgi:hypothetical protein
VIDRMTLAEAGEIFGYWEHSPPAHLMLQTIARLLGWLPAGPASAAVTAEELAATGPPGLAVFHGSEFGMPPPILDVDGLRARNRALSAAIMRQKERAGA